MKIERLAGIPGKPEVRQNIDGFLWWVSQAPFASPGIYGPVRKTEQHAIRAWNAMVRRIRKANAGGSK